VCAGGGHRLVLVAVVHGRASLTAALEHWSTDKAQGHFLQHHTKRPAAASHNRDTSHPPAPTHPDLAVHG
jgi:hypothetical protein